MKKIGLLIFFFISLYLGYLLGHEKRKPQCCEQFSMLLTFMRLNVQERDFIRHVYRSRNFYISHNHDQYPWWDGKEDFYDAYYRHLKNFYRKLKAKPALPGDKTNPASLSSVTGAQH